jgi:uncharacterized protein YjiS (DUF1127 family)
MALQARVAELQLQRNVTQYMAIMTDRELTDIGPSRSNVSQVLSTFASNHARGRDYFLTEMSPPSDCGGRRNIRVVHKSS